MDYPWVTVTESSASDWLEVVKTFEPIRLQLFGVGHTQCTRYAFKGVYGSDPYFYLTLFTWLLG